MAEHETLLGRIENSKREREDHVKKWDQFRKDIAGRNYRKNWLNREAQPLNLQNNYVRIVMPHLVPRNSEIEVAVSPRRAGPGFVEGAERLADSINALLPQIRFVDQAHESVRMGLYSAAILKVGQNARTGIVQEVPSAKAQGKTVVVDIDADRAEANEWLDAGVPFVSAVRPVRFFNDTDAEWLNQSRWCAHEIYRSLESMRADPMFAKYKDTLKANCERPSGMSEKDRKKKAEDPLLSWVKYYEYYDRASRRIRLVPASGCGCEGLLGDLDWTKGIEGFPFSMMVYEHVEGEFWPNPPMGPNYDGRVAVEVVIQTLAEAAKAAKKLLVYDSNQIKPEHVKSLAKARDQEAVGIPGFSTHAKTEEFGGVHPDQYSAGSSLKSLVDEQDGVGDIERGVAKGGQTATSVQAALAMSGVRMDDLKGAALNTMGEVAGMVGAVIVAYQDAYQDVLLPLRQGAQKKLVALGPGVEGEGLDYLYEIVPTSTERVDPAVKQKRTQDLLGQSVDQNLAAKLQSEGKAFSTATLMEEHLRNIGVKDPSRYLVDLNQGGQDAGAKAAAEDQEMISTGQPLPVNPDDDHAAELEVHAADYQQTQSDAIAMHMMEHEQYLQAAPIGGDMGGMPAGAPPMAGIAPGPERPSDLAGGAIVRPNLAGPQAAGMRRAAVA